MDASLGSGHIRACYWLPTLWTQLRHSSPPLVPGTNSMSPNPPPKKKQKKTTPTDSFLTQSRNERAVELFGGGCWPPGRPGAVPGSSQPSERSPAQHIVTDGRCWESRSVTKTPGEEILLGVDSTTAPVRSIYPSNRWRHHLGYIVPMPFLSAKKKKKLPRCGSGSGVSSSNTHIVKVGQRRRPPLILIETTNQVEQRESWTIQFCLNASITLDMEPTKLDTIQYKWLHTRIEGLNWQYQIERNPNWN